MKEVALDEVERDSEAATFAACVATILELPLAAVPRPTEEQDPAEVSTLSRWLGGMGLGLAPVANPASFSWAGPWVARVAPAGQQERRAVVMYGVPSGVVWDPSGVTRAGDWAIVDGFLVAPGDVALARATRPRATSPSATRLLGTVEGLYVAPAAGEPARALTSVMALAGRGLDGDRHVVGTGTFPSGLPGSALTLIEAEVCDSFTPPLRADEHRRNVVTRGIDLNSLVGHEFTIGTVRCRGMRLCEPCRVVAGYASRPVLRQLVHRGGLRADILAGGLISIGDQVRREPG
ncbi:MAG: hypothetical protein M0035_17915 [Actinomycetota bacterium]|nr:hypothetical protein [Actinomycetota bacterium]